MRLPAVAIAGAAIAALLLAVRRSSESDLYFDPVTGMSVDDVPMDAVPVVDNGTDPDLVNYFAVNDVGNIMDPVASLLYVIRSCEHRFPDDVENDACYGIFYGGKKFIGRQDHPVITGECKPVPLSDAMCKAAGFGPGCVSTAAGGYQITRPTWNEVRQAGHWGPYLSDFSNENQDEAARRLFIKDGILPLLEAGNIQGAIDRASRRWASLPGSTAKQGGKSMEFALARYNETAA